MDVSATPDLCSGTTSFQGANPHFEKVFQVIVKSFDGKTTVHRVSWSTMLSELVEEGVDMLSVYQSISDGLIENGDTIRCY